LLLILLVLPPFFSFLLLIRTGELQFDFLLTAEFGWLALISAIILIVGAFLQGRRQGFLATSLGLAVLLLLILLMVMHNPPYALAIVVLVLYNLALLSLLVVAYRFLH
jgi:hypothetical protein